MREEKYYEIFVGFEFKGFVKGCTEDDARNNMDHINNFRGAKLVQANEVDVASKFYHDCGINDIPFGTAQAVWENEKVFII